jgi:hypothetical protein
MYSQQQFGVPSQQHAIARVAEETVLNLKQLESRIEILKNDLAQLCLAVGHPEAARIAATPVQMLGPGVTGNVGFVNPGISSPLTPAFGNLGGIGGYPQQPYATPWQTGFGSPATSGSPWQTPVGSYGAPGTPFVTPFGYQFR